MADLSKNDPAWQKLFAKYDIATHIWSDGHFIISANQIKEFREPRLMTKFDFRSQRPKLFSDNNLSILPISRGEYIISDMEAYADFTDSKQKIEVQEAEFPAWIESLDYKNITSEAAALNCAYASGIIADFVEEAELMSTVNGRMSSLQFGFNIDRKSNMPLRVEVVNSQVEIDGGYEGASSLCLIEAKNNIASDFLIRQLYYPYRLWQNKVGKSVKPVFLVYSNGIFHLREYQFSDPGNYNSIVLAKEKKYRIKEPFDAVINLETICHLLSSTQTVAEPEIPFPQANSMERIINLCEIIESQETEFITKDDLHNNYDFTESESFNTRQVNYYTDAAIYLGFVEKAKNESGDIIFRLTKQGSNLFQLKINERQLKIVSAIIAHRVFKLTLDLYLKKAESPTKHEVVELMKQSKLFGIRSDTTFYRRASSILAWVNWILNLIED